MARGYAMTSLKGSYSRAKLSLPASDLFRSRFYSRMSKRDEALKSFVQKIKSYAGEFIVKGETFKLRFNDVVIMINDGELVNIFRSHRGKNNV
ncbi:MAG: hypothetical protein ACI9HU_000242 [Colwellia sp.]|jgi:hypothetical protein